MWKFKIKPQTCRRLETDASNPILVTTESHHWRKHLQEKLIIIVCKKQYLFSEPLNCKNALSHYYRFKTPSKGPTPSEKYRDKIHLPREYRSSKTNVSFCRHFQLPRWRLKPKIVKTKTRFYKPLLPLFHERISEHNAKPDFSTLIVWISSALLPKTKNHPRFEN